MPPTKMDLATLAEKLADDATIELGGEKFTGADLKAYVGGTREVMTQREQELAAERAAHGQTRQRFEQFEGSTSALLRAAAAEAARDTGNGNGGNGNPPADPDWQLYEQDALLGPFAKAYKKRLMTELDQEYFQPWVQKQLSPLIQQQQRQQELLTTMAIEERQHREYRDLGDWPDKFDLNQARNYGNERGYFVANTTRMDPQSGRTVGVVDLNRVHGEVMGPILQTKRDAEREREITERVTRELRMNLNPIDPLNRTLGGHPAVKAKGKTAEEIFGNVIQDAAQDPETGRLLSQIANTRTIN